MNHRTPLTPRGFTLIESLIALLVVGAGMLMLSVTQTKLVQNADLARQRGEATRLAAEKIESSRAYTTITGTGAAAWNGLAGGSDTSSSNTAYSRSWTLDGDIGQPMRQINVAVSWTDRAGAAQSVNLGSVISRTDPADVGSLAFPLPANTTLKRPKNRNLNIPVPARDLGNGESVVQLANNFAVVFSNESGYVVKTCNFVVNTVADLAGCTTASAYIVAGYISLSGTATFPASLGVNTSLVSGSTAISCSVSNAVDQTSQATINGYTYYLCVVSVAAVGSPWSGRFQLSGMAAGTNYLVCRFQYPAAAGVSSNQRNVQPYSNVVESLDQQNYIVTSGSSCPTVQNLATTAHQDCRSSNASRATDCPAS